MIRCVLIWCSCEEGGRIPPIPILRGLHHQDGRVWFVAGTGIRRPKSRKNRTFATKSSMTLGVPYAHLNSSFKHVKLQIRTR